jgi:hypothetical protein
MNLTRIFALAITLGVLATASSGQETQKPAAPEAAKPADAPPAAAPQAQGRETPPAPPSASAPKTGIIKDDEFIPTQEINPDEDVTFPVDI